MAMELFPIGYYEFSKDASFSYQLNRFYSSGTFHYEELAEIGNRIKNFEEWIEYFTGFGENAEKNGKFLKAAQSYRADEEEYGNDR